MEFSGRSRALGARAAEIPIMQAILCTVSLLAGIALIAFGQSGILAYCLIGLGIGGLVVTSMGRKVR